MSTKEAFKNESPFVRVGTTLYKIVNQPRLNGGHIKKRIVWNNETLRQDYGKDYLASVPKYDGFCTVPDHVNYLRVVINVLTKVKQQKDNKCAQIHKQIVAHESQMRLLLAENAINIS